ncbi:unnamed protein product, partial [Allacma fusca]
GTRMNFLLHLSRPYAIVMVGKREARDKGNEVVFVGKEGEKAREKK